MLKWHSMLLVCLFLRPSCCVALACLKLTRYTMLAQTVGEPPASASEDAPPYLASTVYCIDTINLDCHFDWIGRCLGI